MRQRRQAYHRQGEPSVSEMREDFSRTPIIKLGRLAMWNALNRTVVNLRGQGNSALPLLSARNP